MVVGGLTVISSWCCVVVCCRFFSATTKSFTGESHDASMPLNFLLKVFKGTEHCRKHKGHFERGGGGGCTKIGGAKSPTTALWCALGMKAV